MPPNHFESEVESFLEGSHGDRTHNKQRADHHTVTPLRGTLLLLQPHFRETTRPARLTTAFFARFGLAGRTISLSHPHQTERGEKFRAQDAETWQR